MRNPTTYNDTVGFGASHAQMLSNGDMNPTTTVQPSDSGQEGDREKSEADQKIEGTFLILIFQYTTANKYVWSNSLRYIDHFLSSSSFRSSCRIRRPTPFVTAACKA